MKRCIAYLLLSCIAVLILSACNFRSSGNPAENLDSNDDTFVSTDAETDVMTDQIMMSVLEGTFPLLSQSGQYEKLPEYLARNYYAVITAYAYVDFNGDSKNEMVVKTDSAEIPSIVLYYSGEDVFFFSFSSDQIKQVKSDGTFSGNTFGHLIYSSLEFPGGGYRLVELARADQINGSYTVGGVVCSEETFINFEKEWALKQNASWVNVNSQPVEKPEPESEPTTEAVTEPVEETVDNSYRINIPDQDQPIYAGPGYHYTYVGDIGIAGIYTIVEEVRDGDNNLWGKLKSGIGWIDLNDVRRSDKPITIDYADPDLLISGKFHSFDDHAVAHSTAVAFRAHETLYNVQIFYNTYDYAYNTENEYELFYLKKLTTDKPIVASISFTDTSVYLVSFEDSYGNFYIYEFYESGSDLGDWSGIVAVER